MPGLSWDLQGTEFRGMGVLEGEGPHPALSSAILE